MKTKLLAVPIMLTVLLALALAVSGGKPSRGGKAPGDVQDSGKAPGDVQDANNPTVGVWCVDVKRMAHENELAARKRFRPGSGIIGYVHEVREIHNGVTLFLRGWNPDYGSQLSAVFDDGEGLDKLREWQPVLITGTYNRTWGGLPQFIHCRLVKVAKSILDIGGEEHMLAGSDPDFSKRHSK